MDVIEAMDTVPVVVGYEDFTLTAYRPNDQHPAAVYLAKLAPGSRRAMRDALDTIAGLLTSERCNAKTLEWSALRYQHTAAVRSKLMEGYPSSDREQDAVRLARRLEGVLAPRADGCRGVPQGCRSTGSARLTVPKGRALAFGELQALFAACAGDASLIARRDAAMLAVLCGGGLRRAEVVAFDLADYDSDTGALKVMGKGRKERVVYATNGAKDALDAWLRTRGGEPGPLFVRIGKGEQMTMYRLTDQAVWHILQQRTEQANVKMFSPHDLRRTFISTLWDAGADGVSIQRTNTRKEERPVLK